MDLSSPIADHSSNWLRDHVVDQSSEPSAHGSLTWYVSANRIYLAYQSWAHRTLGQALSFQEFVELMELVFPESRRGRIENQPVFHRVRYYPGPRDKRDMRFPLFGL